MPTAALSVQNLTFRYRSRTEPAIQSISFELQAGELLLIAGASGCGKTTLARCINGLIPRSYKGEIDGSILFNGNDLSGEPLARVSREVGTVLQDPERQILGTRVSAEVAFGLENLGRPRAEITAAVDRSLAYLKILHLRDRETFSLSGGEKQKVALAGVLAMRPNILLLDEPLASLDPASALETLRLVRQLANEGMAVAMVEHRVEDVLKIGPDRVMFMAEGQVGYLGPLAGLAQVVNYHEVKLPAEMIIERARLDPPPAPVEVLPGVGAAAPTVGLSAAQEMRPLVQFEDVTYGYENDRDVLHAVSLEIHRGDVIAVLGPNGAGKTTLVKHAIGLLKPKAGRVLVDGRDTREISVAQVAATLGYVFQSPSHMLFAPSVKEELAFGPTNLGHSRAVIEKEVEDAVRILNLNGLETYSPLALSFGQQKRVSIGAILAMQSRILVMDEPTAGQDYHNYMAFMDAIVQLPSFEAILFITHDVDMAVIYANRVLLVDGGQVVADGPPAEVLHDPRKLEACRLVPTSLLQANLDRYPQTRRFQRAEALAHFSS